MYSILNFDSNGTRKNILINLIAYDQIYRKTINIKLGDESRLDTKKLAVRSI